MKKGIIWYQLYFSTLFLSGVNTSQFSSSRNSIYSLNICSCSHINLIFFHCFNNIVKALVIFLCRAFLTSSNSQKSHCIPCSHSKYETVTPPELARKSGTIKHFWIIKFHQLQELKDHLHLLLLILLEYLYCYQL